MGDEKIAGDWWCPNCREALDGSRVTFQERCDTCGQAVEWIEAAVATEVERLRAETTRLRAELEETISAAGAQALIAERDALRREVARTKGELLAAQEQVVVGSTEFWADRALLAESLLAGTREKLATVEQHEKTAHEACSILYRERDKARTSINLVRDILAEMRADATRSKGGQSVSPRRMPVALSVVIELERAIGPEQAAYTARAWQEEQASLASERAARERAEAQFPKCECGKPATCFGRYEDAAYAYACDECCGHACEDGRCEPLTELPALVNEIARAADRADGAEQSLDGAMRMADAAESRVRALTEEVRVALGTLQKPIADMVTRCAKDQPHDHALLRTLDSVMKRLQDAHDAALAAAPSPSAAPNAAQTKE